MGKGTWGTRLGGCENERTRTEISPYHSVMVTQLNTSLNGVFVTQLGIRERTQ